jgi:hypothetical protein
MGVGNWVAPVVRRGLRVQERFSSGDTVQPNQAQQPRPCGPNRDLFWYTDPPGIGSRSRLVSKHILALMLTQRRSLLLLTGIRQIGPEQQFLPYSYAKWAQIILRHYCSSFSSP